MTNKSKSNEYDRATTEVLKAIKSTTSPTVLSLVVKAAIYARDVSLEKDVEELELNYDRVADAAARKRVKGLCDRIVKLEDRHGIAAVCRTAIAHRSMANKKKAAKSA